MTFIPEKKNALYVRGVVIACGMPDDQNDTAPNKEGIKKIFTNYLKQDSDVQHSYLSNFNVHQLENTITTAPMKINNQEVPVGSWIASHMVLNPNIIAMIRENNLTGYSLGAIGDGGLNDNITFENNFLNKSLMYKDLRDYDELNPFFISFVDKASNGFTWEVLDYNQFLSKSSPNSNVTVDGDIMTNSTQENDEEMVKVSVVERLMQPFLAMNKASDEEQKVEEEATATANEEQVEEPPKEKEKEEEEEVETVLSKEDIMAKLEDMPNLVAEEVVNVMKKLATESMQKQEEASALAKASETEKEEDEEDTVLNKSSEDNKEDVKVEKSSNKLDEMSKPVKVEPRETFLGGTKRDEYGRVRKYL